MPAEVGWARAFAVQGLSDLRVREKLIGLALSAATSFIFYPFPDLDDGDRMVVMVIRLLREAGENYSERAT